MTQTDEITVKFTRIQFELVRRLVEIHMLSGTERATEELKMLSEWGHEEIWNEILLAMQYPQNTPIQSPVHFGLEYFRLTQEQIDDNCIPKDFDPFKRITYG